MNMETLDKIEKLILELDGLKYNLCCVQCCIEDVTNTPVIPEGLYAACMHLERIHDELREQHTIMLDTYKKGLK